MWTNRPSHRNSCKFSITVDKSILTGHTEISTLQRKHAVSKTKAEARDFHYLINKTSGYGSLWIAVLQLQILVKLTVENSQSWDLNPPFPVSKSSEQSLSPISSFQMSSLVCPGSFLTTPYPASNAFSAALMPHAKRGFGKALKCVLN